MLKLARFDYARTNGFVYNTLDYEWENRMRRGRVLGGGGRGGIELITSRIYTHTQRKTFKIHNKVFASPRLNLSKFKSCVDGDSMSVEYELYILVDHIGVSPASGHYICHIKTCGNPSLF